MVDFAAVREAKIRACRVRCTKRGSLYPVIDEGRLCGLVAAVADMVLGTAPADAATLDEAVQLVDKSFRYVGILTAPSCILRRYDAELADGTAPDWVASDKRAEARAKRILQTALDLAALLQALRRMTPADRDRARTEGVLLGYLPPPEAERPAA